MWWRAINLISGLSFLICIASAALWIISLIVTRPAIYRGEIKPVHLYNHGDPAQVAFELEATNGRLLISKTTGSKTIWMRGGEDYMQRTLKEWTVLGFDFDRYVRVKTDAAQRPLPGTYGQVSRFWVPLYWPVFLFGILPVSRFFFVLERRRRRRLRKVDHLCPSCGYDIRATPDACPECGTKLFLQPR